MFLFNVHGDRENKNTNLGFIKSISLHFAAVYDKILRS